MNESNEDNLKHSMLKFDQSNEIIFCPLQYKDGNTGHGLLKKYYIQSLKKTICEYCEVVLDGQVRNLTYFLRQNDCKHLIKDFGEWKDEFVKAQNINKHEIKNDLKNSIELTFSYLAYPLSKANDQVRLLLEYQESLEKNIIPFINQVEELKNIKEIMSALKFDENGKVDLAGIGKQPNLEYKLIWLALFLINLQSVQSIDNQKDFDFSKDLIALAKEIVRNLFEECLYTFDFLKFLCDKLLPELYKLEGEENTKTLTYGELIKDFKFNNNEEKIKDLNKIIFQNKESLVANEIRIKELESLNRDLMKYKEYYINEKSNNEDLKKMIEKQNQIISEIRAVSETYKLKIEDLEKLNQQLSLDKLDSEKNLIKSLKEGEINYNDKIMKLEAYINEKDLVIKNQRDESDDKLHNQAQLKERIYELQMHMLKDQEDRKTLEFNYEKLQRDYEIVLKRHEFFTNFLNETRFIMNTETTER